MKVISVINYKGGVGKTTITSNLSASLANRGYKVLAIDLDPQSNLTFSFFELDEWKNKYAENKTIKNWFEETEDIKFQDLVLSPKKITNNNLDIVSSHIGLINSDLEIAYNMGGIIPAKQRDNFIKAHNFLKKGIKSLRGYDIVLIDCPPNFNMITRNAIVASDYYIVPIKLDYLSTLGLSELKEHINTLENDYNSKLRKNQKSISPEFLGVVCNMISRRKEGLISAESHYLAQLREANLSIFNTMLRENKSVYADAPKEGIPVSVRKLNSSYENISKELSDLTDEFLERINL